MTEKILTSKEMLHGCQATYPSLKNWVEKEGLEAIRQSPWLFNRKKAVAWIKKNKPERYDHFVKYLEMLEG